MTQLNVKQEYNFHVIFAFWGRGRETTTPGQTCDTKTFFCFLLFLVVSAFRNRVM